MAPLRAEPTLACPGQTIYRHQLWMPLLCCTETAFVGENGKPSLAVLSLGCGGTSEMSAVPKNAGPIDWVVKGPLIDILGTGAGELNAAISQQLAREWPVSCLVLLVTSVPPAVFLPCRITFSRAACAILQFLRCQSVR